MLNSHRLEGGDSTGGLVRRYFAGHSLISPPASLETQQLRCKFEVRSLKFEKLPLNYLQPQGAYVTMKSIS